MSGDRPLLFPLSGLLAELPGAKRHHEIDEPTLDLPEDLALAEGVRGIVDIARTNRGVYVHASVRTAIAGACSRCLRDLALPIAVEVKEEALPSIDLTTGAALDTSAEPEVARLDGHHELDLEAMLVEAISLAEPFAPLCEPDCPGLCLECGERLDADHVEHPSDDVDPRLAALLGFRVDGEGQTG